MEERKKKVPRFSPPFQRLLCSKLSTSSRFRFLSRNRTSKWPARLFLQWMRLLSREDFRERLFLFTLVMWMTGITNHALDSSNHDTKFGNRVDGPSLLFFFSPTRFCNYFSPLILPQYFFFYLEGTWLDCSLNYLTIMSYSVILLNSSKPI